MDRTHDPGCDRQHTWLQPCNEPAAFPGEPSHGLAIQQSSRVTIGIVVEVLLSGLMLAAWFATRPSDVYDDDGGVLLAVFLSLFISGLGWHLLGGWGCATGCAFQLMRLAGFVALVVYSFAAFNPHMDNWCNDDPDFEACMDRAVRSFTWIYFALALSPLISAAFLAMRQPLGISAPLRLDE